MKYIATYVNYSDVNEDADELGVWSELEDAAEFAGRWAEDEAELCGLTVKKSHYNGTVTWMLSNGYGKEVACYEVTEFK